jgi:hypothetical protein
MTCCPTSPARRWPARSGKSRCRALRSYRRIFLSSVESWRAFNQKEYSPDSNIFWGCAGRFSQPVAQPWARAHISGPCFGCVSCAIRECYFDQQTSQYQAFCCDQFLEYRSPSPGDGPSSAVMLIPTIGGALCCAGFGLLDLVGTLSGVGLLSD